MGNAPPQDGVFSFGFGKRKTRLRGAKPRQVVRDADFGREVRRIERLGPVCLLCFVPWEAGIARLHSCHQNA